VGVEQCDDGNAVNTDLCTNVCKTAACGDSFLQPGAGEQCDDGNLIGTDACTATCKTAICGDAIVQAGVEQCDDGNAVNTDGCVTGCKAAKCGDGFKQLNVEDCDDGNLNNNDGCSALCKVEVTKCGNGVIDPGERCDTALPPPFTGVTCKPVSCLYDFSQVTQLYCNGGCTWAGAQDCDQADANILCRLKTGNPNSIATGWTSTTAQPTFGFPCAPLGYGTLIGPIPEYGVAETVRYQNTSILADHGPGNIILNPMCTNP
jgi:cysteine-rich repeat protein